MSTSSKKNWKDSTTIVGMLAVFLGATAVAVCGTIWPDFVPRLITDASIGAAVTSIGAIMLRFNSAQLKGGSNG